MLSSWQWSAKQEIGFSLLGIVQTEYTWEWFGKVDSLQLTFSVHHSSSALLQDFGEYYFQQKFHHLALFLFRPKGEVIIFFSLIFLESLVWAPWPNLYTWAKKMPWQPLAQVVLSSWFLCPSQLLMGFKEKPYLLSSLPASPKEATFLHSPAMTEMQGCEGLTSYMVAKDPSGRLASPGEGGFAGFMVSLNTQKN